MAVATRILQYLGRRTVPYQLVHHERVGTLAAAVRVAGVPVANVVTTSLLIDAKGILMAILPFGQELDLAAVRQRFRRNFQWLPEPWADRLFCDCEPGSRPALAPPYGLAAVIDEALLGKECLYFQSGSHHSLIRMDGDYFFQVNARATRGRFARPLSEQTSMTAFEESPDICQRSIQQLSERLKKLYRLPPMPSVAARVMSLAADPNTGARELAWVIEQDPSLAAQIMRYASSALFNYQGQLRNVQDAVNRVLGFDRVCHIALGIAASRAFEIPKEGPLGLDAFWQHSLYCSLLSQMLATHADKELNLQPSTAYLCGLLHNFGLLLIGHLFKPEFVMLNKLAAKEPESPLAVLEKQVVGMGGAQELIALGHGAIGAILLEHWNLPAEVRTVAAMHHVEGYWGEHAGYVQVVQLANSLLKDLAIGDDLCLDDPAPLMEALGLAPEVAYEILQQVQQHASEVQSLARQLAA